MLAHGSRAVVRAYVDLRNRDIAQLTEIFAYDDKDTIKLVCQALPSHLKWRFSLTSPFCATHNKLNFFPLEHLFDSMRDTVNDELKSVWLPLIREGNVLNQAQVDWISAVHNHPALVRHKCAACNLTSVALDITLVVAMGSIHMATLNSKHWEKSKRIMWLEHCLLARVELSSQKEIVGDMWETGKAMRRLREKWKNKDVVHRSHTVKRGYDEHQIEQTSKRMPPTRPPRGPEVQLPERVAESDEEPLSQHEHITRDTVDFMQDVITQHRAGNAIGERAGQKVTSQHPKAPAAARVARASSLYSHRPESAMPNFNVTAAQLFTHSEGEVVPVPIVDVETPSENISTRSFHFCADELFSDRDDAESDSSIGHESPTVDSILAHYDKSQDPPTPLIVGKVSPSEPNERSLAVSTAAIKRFSRPCPISMEINNRGEDVEPDLNTPKVWKRRSQRDGTLWRYGENGEMIQVTFEEYREAVEEYGNDCGIFSQI